MAVPPRLSRQGPRPYNAILAYPNYLQARPEFARVRLGGGGWRRDLPLENLIDGDLSNPARSINCTREATRFWVDLGLTRTLMLGVIPFGNFSLAARWRFGLYRNPVGEFGPGAQTAEADSGWLDIYPRVFDPSVLSYRSPSWWYLRMTAEQAYGVRMPALWIADAEVSGRYLWVEIDDPENPDGFIEIPELFVAPGWQPSLNYSYGAALAWEDGTRVTKVDSGKVYFDQRPKNRVMNISYDLLPEVEVRQIAYELQRELGVSGRLYFIGNKLLLEDRHRICFTARLRTLSPMEQVFYARQKVAFTLEEVVS